MVAQVAIADAKPRRPMVTRISAETVPQQALQDLIDGARLYELWGRLAMHDTRQRFRRSVLGPLWLTLSMGVMVGALGIVFSALFHQDMGKMLPHIATGLIFWGLLTGCINDGTAVFVSAESYIRNVPGPLSVHFYRMMTRNIIIWGFNMAIYVIIVLWFDVPIGWNTLGFFPGFLLFLVNAGWMALAAGILSTRYRDIPQVVTNMIQVVFFLTPIFWSAETLPSRPTFIVWNPFYHMIEIVRDPLLNQQAPLMSWVFCLVMAAVGLACTALLYRKAHARIPYWV